MSDASSATQLSKNPKLLYLTPPTATQFSKNRLFSQKRSTIRPQSPEDNASKNENCILTFQILSIRPHSPEDTPDGI